MYAEVSGQLRLFKTWAVISRWVLRRPLGQVPLLGGQRGRFKDVTPVWGGY